MAGLVKAVNGARGHGHGVSPRGVVLAYAIIKVVVGGVVAASPKSRFETEVLAQVGNRSALAETSG